MAAPAADAPCPRRRPAAPRAPAVPGIAAACCDRWADGSGRIAVVHLRPDGSLERIGHDALRSASVRFAQVLLGRGIGRGARIAILLPPGPEMLVAVLAAQRIGAIAVLPGATSGPAALAGRLRTSGAAALVADEAGLAPLAREALPALREVFCVFQADRPPEGPACFWQAIAEAPDKATVPLPDAGAAGLLLHAADSTGHVRGVLHAQRAVAAQQAGFAAVFGATAGPEDLFWTAADWAGCGGLLDAVLPALAQGMPVLAHAMPAFDAQRAAGILSGQGVTAALLPPAALHALHDAGAAPPPGHPLRRLATLGATLGPRMVAWAEGAFGTPLQAIHARVEYGAVLAGPAAGPWRALPGRGVMVLDAAGAPLPPGQPGQVALRRSDPSRFLGYWRDRAATRAACPGPWMPTGIVGVLQPGGGILPAEGPLPEAGSEDVEACLRSHPAVAEALLLRPQRAQGEEGAATVVVVPRQGSLPGPDLAAELRGFLRARFSGRLCPRRVAFARDLPRVAPGPQRAGLLEATRGMGAGAAGR